MSTETSLKATYEGSNGKDFTLTFNYADPDAETSDVKALNTAIINNGAIYENAPVKCKSMKLVTTETHEFNMSD